MRILAPAAVAAICATLALLPAHAETVTPEIAAACTKRWGTDYEMQVYCRKKQMEALRKLNGNDIGQPKVYRMPEPDETGDVLTCRFKKLPHMIINLTRGHETIVASGKSYTVRKGSQFWSAGPFIIAFNGRVAGHRGTKVWAQDQQSNKEENAICK